MGNKLSIVCITYNQGLFIRQALNSFLMQKTNFPFEIIIGDDCSIDATPVIIKEYAQKYPEIIKPILREENIGATQNFVDTLSRVKTKYLAICEGDDYWTDPYKLQKQVDFLEAHPEFSACFHPVKVIWENGEQADSIYPDKKTMTNLRNKVTLKELLKQNLIQTNSIVYRWRFSDCDVKNYFPNGILPSDWYLHLLHAQVGDIAYLPDCMGVYRRNSGGIWYDTNPQKTNLHLKHGVREIKFYMNVWKNIANRSEEYWNQILPGITNIMNIYYKNGNIEKLQEIKSLYPNIFEQELKTDKDILFKALEQTKKKYKKYKKLFNIFLYISISLLFMFAISISLILKMN